MPWKVSGTLTACSSHGIPGAIGDTSLPVQYTALNLSCRSGTNLLWRNQNPGSCLWPMSLFYNGVCAWEGMTIPTTAREVKSLSLPAQEVTLGCAGASTAVPMNAVLPDSPAFVSPVNGPEFIIHTSLKSISNHQLNWNKLWEKGKDTNLFVSQRKC